MPLFKNCKIDVLRSRYNSVTGGTSQPTTNLTRVFAHIEPLYAHHYAAMPSAVKATMIFNVDVGIDIQTGDVIANVTLLDDVTPWPGDTSQNNVAWNVSYVKVTAAGPLASRIIYVDRTLIGGPAHP